MFFIEGTYPRTRSLTERIRALDKYNSRLDELLHGENLLFVTKLKDAYISSRCIPRTYDSEEANLLAKLVVEVFDPLVLQTRID